MGLFSKKKDEGSIFDSFKEQEMNKRKEYYKELDDEYAKNLKASISNAGKNFKKAEFKQEEVTLKASKYAKKNYKPVGLVGTKGYKGFQGRNPFSNKEKKEYKGFMGRNPFA